MSYNDDQKRKLIMSHYLKPKHFGKIDGVVPVQTFSQRCVDNAIVYTILNDNVIKNIKAESEGCAVFKSSLDILIDQLINKDLDEAKKIINEFEKMIQKKSFDHTKLNELNIYNKVGEKFNRVDCVLTSIESIKKTLI